MTSPARKRRHSLSGKLIVLFLFMGVVFVLLVGGGIRHAFQEHFRSNIRPHITQYLEYVRTDIGSPPDRGRARQLADKLNIEIQIFDTAGRWSSTGRITDLEDIAVEQRFRIDGTEYLHVEDDAHQHYLMARDDDATLLFNVPRLRDERSGFRGWIPLLILLALLLVLYHATRRLFKPLDAIRAGVQKFGAGNMEHRIDIRRKDELGELAASINTMAGDIQQMLDAKRQLLLAISHELRSPLTRARVAAEMLEADHRKDQIVQDINEMENLIEELIETERLSSPHRTLNRTRTNIAELVEEAVQTWFGSDGIALHRPENPVMLDVDAARIRLLLKNLLQNALRHTPAGAPAPEIDLAMDGKRAIITVTDHGRGIDARHLKHLTEPFYRVDPSRRRETGGYGLGLYLCRMIVEAHDGRLDIDSAVGKGTRVSISLPV